MTLLRAILVALLAVISLPGEADARLVPVATYPELRDACQNALPGDTIIVAPGTYTISGATRIMITGRPGPVVLKGASGIPADVVIRGQGQDNTAVQMVFNLDNSPGWIFRDITVKDSYYHGFKFDHASTDCALINVVMRDHGESGVKGTSDPAAGTYPDRLLIERCDIGFTQTTGGTRSVVEGVDGVGVNDWVIRDSRFVNVQKNGASAYAIFTKGNSSNTIIESNRFENCFIGASFGGGGTGAQFFRDNDQTYEHRNGIIRNNIFMHCTDAGIYINKGVNCRIYNNTVFECELTIQLRFAQSSGDVRNNLVRRSPSNLNEPIIRLRDGAVLLGSSGNFAAVAADFVQPTGSYSQLDLHLAPSSQAIDAGTPLPNDVPFDFEGQRRPYGSGWDSGADEFNAVPVELSSFTAVASADQVMLRWRTESETDNYGFEIQRAEDERPFHTLGFVAGNGTTLNSREYEFLDQNAVKSSGTTMRYRLRQIDYSGADKLLPEVVVYFDRSDTSLSLDVWPNPSNGNASVAISCIEPVLLRIADITGRIIGEHLFDAGGRIIPLHLTATGMYFLSLHTSTEHRSIPLFIR